jgi:crooked neck
MESGKPRATRVLNKSAAPIQISAEQLMREAWERQDSETRAPMQKIGDEEELGDYQLKKRTAFENQLRAKRHSMSIWLRYAKWEESQHEYTRARSIYERALQVDYKNAGLYLKYAEMEMRTKNINHARNLWDRAVQLLPRTNALWYKYIFMEEQLHNYIGVRRIYERWMEWEPEENAWKAYIAFETRNEELELVRQVYQRFVMCHQNTISFIKYARFEEKQGEIANARVVYEKALEVLDQHVEQHARLYIAFGEFEERAKEIERARAIYKFALDRIPKNMARDIFQKFIQFEKQHGDKDAIELIIVGKRRFQYEEMLATDNASYDVWFDYIKLEESFGNKDKIREVYERSIASDNMPPVLEKQYWKRYIYLWINYALFEELQTKDYERTREIYQTIMKIIPHKIFSFNKLWKLYAEFEIRRQNLQGARKIYGNAIGMAPSRKIFTWYIELEMQLAEIDRCRKIFEAWLQFEPSNCLAWKKFAELEADPQIMEIDRARGILEMAIAQPVLDLPEVLWKAYIDFEIENEETARARALYRRLLERTKHVRVWISFAKFEIVNGNIKEARKIYQEAFISLKSPAELQEQRVLLIESWRDFEEEFGDPQTQLHVKNNMPTRIIKRKKITNEDGTDAGVEEHYEYIFNDQKNVKAGSKLLEAARKWKEQKEMQIQ